MKSLAPLGTPSVVDLDINVQSALLRCVCRLGVRVSSSIAFDIYCGAFGIRRRL
jgi:hypothetical protein